MPAYEGAEVNEMVVRANDARATSERTMTPIKNTRDEPRNCKTASRP